MGVRARSILAVVIVVFVFYVYIISVHRVQDLEDVRAVVSAVSSTSVSDRCKMVDGMGTYRCLPNVLFIGASKCGTTSLVAYMDQHENISFVSRRIHKVDKHREIHRFDRNTFGMALKSLELGDEWASSPIVASPDISVVHYTPHYLYAPTVPYEVKRFYTHEATLKFVVMLREPVKRAWSSYWFHNSHLIQDVDRGSVEEFLRLAREEITQREQYNACMDTELSKYSIYTAHTTSVTTVHKAPKYLLILVDLFMRLNRTNTHTTLTTRHTTQTTTDTAHTTQETIAQLENILYASNAQCFGSLLRSPLLGGRHIDKGVYIDQILRWYASFAPHQFHFMPLDKFATSPTIEFQALLEFMTAPSSTDGESAATTTTSTGATSIDTKVPLHNAVDNSLSTIDFTKKRLETPNTLMPAFSTIPYEDVEFLYEYYKPYNELLTMVGLKF